MGAQRRLHLMDLPESPMVAVHTVPLRLNASGLVAQLNKASEFQAKKAVHLPAR